jgi:hypothetical protein
MLKQVRRILIATIPVTFTVIGLTASGASALPRSCAAIGEQASEFYDLYMSWNDLWNADFGVKPIDVVMDEAEIARGYYGEYQRSLAAAARAGCF